MHPRQSLTSEWMVYQEIAASIPQRRPRFDPQLITLWITDVRVGNPRSMDVWPLPNLRLLSPHWSFWKLHFLPLVFHRGWIFYNFMRVNKIQLRRRSDDLSVASLSYCSAHARKWLCRSDKYHLWHWQSRFVPIDYNRTCWNNNHFSSPLLFSCHIFL